MSFSPEKRQKGAKVGGAVEKNQLFCILFKIGSLDFFHILHKVEGIKGYKLPQTPFFRKILVLQILAIFGHFWLKNTICILFNIGTLDIFDILNEVRDH